MPVLGLVLDLLGASADEQRAVQAALRADPVWTVGVPTEDLSTEHVPRDVQSVDPPPSLHDPRRPRPSRDRSSPGCSKVLTNCRIPLVLEVSERTAADAKLRELSERAGVARVEVVYVDFEDALVEARIKEENES